MAFGPFVAAGSGVVWSSLSALLMESAALFARDAYALERAHSAPNVPPEIEARHRAYVLGGILASASAVEAFANEAFTIPSRGNKLLGVLWRSVMTYQWKGIERAEQPLAKLQLALRLGGFTQFATGSEPYQSAALSMKLRNAMAHFKARELSDVTPAGGHLHSKLERSLRQRLQPSPFYPPGVAMFPYGCVSHECIEWVVESHLALLDEFCSRTRLASLRAGGRKHATR